MKVVDYVFRPDLTNKTHEDYSRERSEFIGRKVELEIPKRAALDRPKPRQRGEAGLHVREHYPANWHSAPGVSRKRRRIERLGMPVMHEWRFTTLTVCRWQYADGSLCFLRPDECDEELFPVSPLEMYLAGNKRMREFLKRLRVLLIIHDECPWAWKLEFQLDGFPHWHLLLGRTRKFSCREMKLISEAWGLGRVNNEMISEENGLFCYGFKYVFKSVHQWIEEEDYFDPDFQPVPELALPAWFADYKATKTVKVRWTDDQGVKHVEQREKTVTFARARFWQASSNFYTSAKRKKAPVEPKEPVKCLIPETVRDQADRVRCSVLVIARKSSGKYLSSAIIRLSVSTADFWQKIHKDAISGGAVGLSVGSFIAPVALIRKHSTCNIKLDNLCLQNSMSLQAARRLQSRRTSLLTC